MTEEKWCYGLRACVIIGFLSLAVYYSSSVHAASSHCLSRYDECKYSAGFAYFDYVNPDAPKGGEIKLADSGTFDSLNPFILKGVKAPAIAGLFDTLMVPSFDEPETMYGLIAQSVNVAADRGSVTFQLNPAARWHDGEPITAADVVFTFHVLKEQGDPTYQIMYAPVEKVEQISERAVTFIFKEKGNRELPLIAAAMPILPKHYYDIHDFTQTTLEPPVGSGPYRVVSVDPGRSIIYARVENYWARNLPVNRGQYNFERIRYDMYRDENVMLEAFKGGAYDFRQEYIARNWATAYDSPAIRDGRLIKVKIPDSIPQGMQAFVFNTRLNRFVDRRVREAIGLTLDFEWLNRTIFYDAYARNQSFFENTQFQAKGAPQGGELALLAPYKSILPADLFVKSFQVPRTDGSGNIRPALKKADALLKEAGWVIKDGKRVNTVTGEPLTIEFLLHQPTMQRVILPMRQNLERLGIEAFIRFVDTAQYQKRVEGFDFDVISIWINRGVFFPGNEQVALWHSTQADVRGSNNVAGAKNPAVDAALDALMKAQSLDELTAAGRALDRVLLWEHYVIPHWHSNSFRVAYWNKFGRPKNPPPYNLAFQTWWVKP